MIQTKKPSKEEKQNKIIESELVTEIKTDEYIIQVYNTLEGDNILTYEEASGNYHTYVYLDEDVDIDEVITFTEREAAIPEWARLY